jgi:protein-S-isoprenylcysteine O-methyltransferase Ste14
MVWLWWVDSYLIRALSGHARRRDDADGPFRYIRHPRYVGLLIGRFAVAAMLGSVIGWLQCAGVFLLFTRRMLREETAPARDISRKVRRLHAADGTRPATAHLER